MELKDRIVIISEKNIDRINALYGKCTTDELEHIVNNMIDNAVAEINEDRRRLHMDKKVSCAECEFMKRYDYGNRIYYCDHEGRNDDMGKIGVNELPKGSPQWCPLRNNESEQ